MVQIIFLNTVITLVLVAEMRYALLEGGAAFFFHSSVRPHVFISKTIQLTFYELS
jgi:hypothetical protein